MKLIDSVKDTLVGMRNKENRRQFYRYAVSGLSAWLTEFISFNLLLLIVIEGTPLRDIPFFAFAGINGFAAFDFNGTNLCQSISLLLGTIVSYTMNRLLSFKSKNKMLPEIIRFGILFLVNLVITNVVIRLLQLVIPFDWICKLIVQCMMVLWNFFIYKLIIFRPRAETKEEPAADDEKEENS